MLQAEQQVQVEQVVAAVQALVYLFQAVHRLLIVHLLSLHLIGKVLPQSLGLVLSLIHI